MTCGVHAPAALPPGPTTALCIWLPRPCCSAFAVFFYLHMDCLDGKQARRTKNSSPLGQLFDHGGLQVGVGGGGRQGEATRTNNSSPLGQLIDHGVWVCG